MKKLSLTLLALLLMAKAFCQTPVNVTPLTNPDFSGAVDGQGNINGWGRGPAIPGSGWAQGTIGATGTTAAVINPADATNTTAYMTSDGAPITLVNPATPPGFVFLSFDFNWISNTGSTPTTLTLNIFTGPTGGNIITIGTINTPDAATGGPATFVGQPGFQTNFPAEGIPSGSGPIHLTFSVPIPSVAVVNGDPYFVHFEAASTPTSYNVLQVTNFFVDLTDVPLPVTLEYFTGTKQQKNIKLQWKTAKEDNLDRYEIEQSRNGADFARIGVVTPHGIEKAYEFNNESTLSGDVYYRLKSVDKDGKFEYSKTLNFKMESAGTVSIFPNPVIDKLSVQGNFSTDKTYQVRIVNTLGQTLKMLDCTPTEDGVISVNQVDAFPKGVYMVEVADKKVITRGQFVH